MRCPPVAIFRDMRDSPRDGTEARTQRIDLKILKIFRACYAYALVRVVVPRCVGTVEVIPAFVKGPMTEGSGRTTCAPPITPPKIGFLYLVVIYDIKGTFLFEL